MDWQKIGEEAVELTRGYLRVNTTNPPGGETAGTRFLAEVLNGAGIASETAESAPGRGNLVARVRGDGSLGGIVIPGGSPDGSCAGSRSSRSAHHR